MIDRNESLRDKIATIVQAGYSQRKTSVETADEIKSKISFLSILTRLERENAELRRDVWRWQNEHLRLLAENAELLAANAELINVCAELSATADELRAENAELRREKARLDWLERPQQITHYVNPFRDVVHRTNSGQTLREAIDAAMEAGK